MISMYKKCGSVEDACRVFNIINQKEVVIWTIMIARYAMHGHGEEALNLFILMQ